MDLTNSTVLYSENLDLNASVLSNWSNVVKVGKLDHYNDDLHRLNSLLSAHPYEPAGWNGIGTVFLFGFIFFVPIAGVATLQIAYQQYFGAQKECDGISPDSNCFDKTIAIVKKIVDMFLQVIRNTIHAKEKRKEDINALGTESALILVIQREIIRLVFVLTLLSCCVLVPIHLHVGSVKVTNEFSESTVQHLEKHDPALWTHVIFVQLFTILVIRFINRCKKHVSWMWCIGYNNANKNTDLWDGIVFVSGISPRYSENDICRVLASLYPGEIHGVAVVLDAAYATRIRRKIIGLEQTLHTLTSYNDMVTKRKHNRVYRTYMKLYYGLIQSTFCLCHNRTGSPCCHLMNTMEIRDKIELVKEKISKLKELERNITPENSASSGRAFITFAQTSQANEFIKKKSRREREHNRLNELASIDSTGNKHANDSATPFEKSVSFQGETIFENEPFEQHHVDASNGTAASELHQVTSLANAIRGLDIASWNVQPSPTPHDIIWGSLHLNPAISWIRVIIVNGLIIAALALVTTPVALLVFLSRITGQHEVSWIANSYLSFVNEVRLYSTSLGNFFFSFVPQLMLVLVNSLLVNVIYFLCKYWEPHHTRSAQQISILHKSYWFLLFNTLLLPALAFRSMNAFVSDIVIKKQNLFILLGRVFIVSSGAFILCYIITQTWVGEAFDILNVSESLWRCIRGSIICRPYSTKEQRQHAKTKRYPFEFGQEYATILTMFSLCLLFSTMVPVILPFGLLYFVVKIAVVDYRLKHHCSKQKVHKNPKPKIGRVAVRYLIAPLLLYQASVIGFFLTYVCVPGEVLGWTGWKVLPNEVSPESNPNVEIKPCVNENSIPGTIAVRGGVMQLLLLYFTFGGTLVYGLLAYFMEPTESEMENASDLRDNGQHWQPIDKDDAYTERPENEELDTLIDDTYCESNELFQEHNNIRVVDYEVDQQNERDSFLMGDSLEEFVVEL